jgi:hypothetical protein
MIRRASAAVATAAVATELDYYCKKTVLLCRYNNTHTSTPHKIDNTFTKKRKE